ncbi:MAG: 30S ribosomal protein S4 [Candidatus Kapaibacteriota bacterium]|jgi:small subunit ribosomal protein S4
MNYNGPKVKLSRKIAIPMTPKASKVMQDKAYPPGQHGPTKRKGKMSDYGKQLLEKQRLRLQYNVAEKKLSNYFKEAAKSTGNTGEILMQLLESRLDVLVLRAGFVRTMYAARQVVSHGHILVNGRKLDVSSYRVKVNDVISIKSKSRTNETLQESMRNNTPPAYLELNKADFSVKYLYTPPMPEIPVKCEIPLVVEFYSR